MTPKPRKQSRLPPTSREVLEGIRKEIAHQAFYVRQSYQHEHKIVLGTGDTVNDLQVWRSCLDALLSRGLVCKILGEAYILAEHFDDSVHVLVPYKKKKQKPKKRVTRLELLMMDMPNDL